MRQSTPLPVLQLPANLIQARNTSRPVMLIGFQNQGNLGLGYLAAVLRKVGYTVHVVDIEQEPEKILEIALKTGPVLIGFSLIFQFFIDRYAALLYLFRANGITCHFTMGGHFPSLSYEQTLELVPELDSIVRFEGESTLLELVDAVSLDLEWRGVHGIAYRNGEEIVTTQARALLDQQEDRLSKTRVYAPIDGTVTTLDIKVGETAIASSTNIPGSSLMTIANPATIQTEVNVDEADIANVEIGQKAQVVAIAYPDAPVQGVVESIAVSAKVATGQQGQSFAIKIRLLEPEKITLRPGMTCRAEIFTATKGGVLAAPIQSILVDENLSTDAVTRDVFVNRNGRAVKVSVEVGIADDTYQEIVSGLKPGDEVVTGPDRVLRALEDGDRISPTVEKRSNGTTDNESGGGTVSISAD